MPNRLQCVLMKKKNLLSHLVGLQVWMEVQILYSVSVFQFNTAGGRLFLNKGQTYVGGVVTFKDKCMWRVYVCLLWKAQKDAGECHIKIPVITFDSPEEEKEEPEEGEETTDSEENHTPKLQKTTSQSEEFHLCRETTSSESTTLGCPDQEHHGLQMTTDSTPSPQLTNDNSSSGIDVHSHPDDTDPLEPNIDSQGFLRLPQTVGRYGPGGRTHIRGLSMDSGKDAVLLSDRSHNPVCLTLFLFFCPCNHQPSAI